MTVALLCDIIWGIREERDGGDSGSSNVSVGVRYGILLHSNGGGAG